MDQQEQSKFFIDRLNEKDAEIEKAQGVSEMQAVEIASLRTRLREACDLGTEALRRLGAFEDSEEWKEIDSLRKLLKEARAEVAAKDAEIEQLREALSEIARPKRGGIEHGDSDADHIAYWVAATERERRTAREALSRLDAARKDGE